MVRDIKDGLKYVREDNREASSLSFVSHHDKILEVQRVFQVCFDGGDCRVRRGSGRPYCWVMVLS